MPGLPVTEIAVRLAEAEDRTHEGVSITKLFRFDSFKDALAFVNRVADLAEEMRHHPHMDIRYKEVRLSSTSHDAGALTDRDFDMVSRVDALLERR